MSGGARSLSLLALGAFAAHFDHWALGGEARCIGGGANTGRQFVVVDMHRAAAAVADQEDTVMQAARMAVGDKGVGALNPADEVVHDEQVENAIDAIRRYPCLLYTSDAADERSSVDLGGRRIINKKKSERKSRR
mgnify:CR=1 FL=1